MGVLFRRRSSGDNDEDDDATTSSLTHSGVYRLSDLGDDEEIKRFKASEVTYSFWDAVKLTSILTILLWWLPIFGQMIAGYVGGRRAGSPGKAVLAALVPVLIILTITSLFDAGTIPSQVGGFDINPKNLLANFGIGVPFLEPYMQFAGQYIMSFMGAVQSVTLLKVDNYIVCLAFAYIGGVLARQTFREIEYVSEHSGHETNIVVGRDMEPDEAPKRSHRPSARPMALRKRLPTPLISRAIENPTFDHMQPVEGDAEFSLEQEEQPAHTTRRHLTEELERKPAKNRKAIASNVKRMESEQRKVERKVKHRSPVTDGLVPRSKHARTQPQVAKEEGEPAKYEYI